MNKRDHVLNGVLVGIGVGVILATADDLSHVSHSDLDTLKTVVAVTVPVVLGAMVPDIDAVLGTHRKTLHNLPVLAVFVAFPAVFGNLQYVWIGVVTHFVLDCLGSKRGIALFYPLASNEWNPYIGVKTDSKYASAVTVLVTVFEIAVAVVMLLGTTL
jgi:membrane-bound metal-dependent hydrolase YbcI (DUF457 family)